MTQRISTELAETIERFGRLLDDQRITRAEYELLKRGVLRDVMEEPEPAGVSGTRASIADDALAQQDTASRSVSTDTSSVKSPGWRPDPDQPDTQIRWHDGDGWTDHTSPRVPPGWYDHPERPTHQWYWNGLSYTGESRARPEAVVPSPSSAGRVQGSTSSYNRPLLAGILMLVLGGIITAGTYGAAAEGGTYVITTGLFVVGGINLIRGIYRQIRT